MKEVMVSRLVYKCDYCGHEFKRACDCKQHERYEHQCKECDHAYYAYGIELNCERENQGKPCRFKKKRDEE